MSLAHDDARLPWWTATNLQFGFASKAVLKPSTKPQQRTILDDSVKAAMLQFLALPISKALIDSIKETVNTYMRSLIQRGALIDGDCTYDPNDNLEANVSNGQLVFQINFIGGIPAERITFNSFLDISLLKALNQ